jgi:hypothetical protein
MTAPTLVAELHGEQLRVWCIHCCRWHHHGPGEGHRVAHCDSGPYATTGYTLVADKPAVA